MRQAPDGRRIIAARCFKSYWMITTTDSCRRFFFKRGESRRMKGPFAASVWGEDEWYVAQCPELDIASQGETEDEALSNLKEALELYFEQPCATRPPLVRTIEVEVGGA